MESADPRVSSTEGRSRDACRFRPLLFLAWAVAGALIVVGLGCAMWRLGTNAYYAYRPRIELKKLFDDTGLNTMLSEVHEEVVLATEEADDPETVSNVAVAANNRLFEQLVEKIDSELRKERKRRLDAVFMWAILAALAGAGTFGWFFAGIRYRIWIHASPAMPSRSPPGERILSNGEAAIPADPDSNDVIAGLLKHR